MLHETASSGSTYGLDGQELEHADGKGPEGTVDGWVMMVRQWRAGIDKRGTDLGSERDGMVLTLPLLSRG